jgi:hypothetical protein
MDDVGGAQKLAFYLWAAFEDRALSDDDALEMTSAVPLDAVLKGFDRFARYCETPHRSRKQRLSLTGLWNILNYPVACPRARWR